MLKKWLKTKQHGGPDIWNYKDSHVGVYPAIALLKKNNKVIAEFWGPIDLVDEEIIEHVKSKYRTKGKLQLHRIAPEKKVHTLIIE